MIRNILSSSNKTIGTVEITEQQIIVNNNSKPQLIIDDTTIVNAAINLKPTADIIQQLYDEYTLTVGEVAAIFNFSYTKANHWFKDVAQTAMKAGRRNSSFGKTFSVQRRSNISKSLAGKPTTSTYIRTPEIKAKIAAGLKKYFEQHPQNPQPHIDNWAKGKYQNVNFGHGIAGYFYSLKNQTKLFFRSLLELNYMLRLEQDDSVLTYEYETLHILCDNGHTYTPDIVVNNKEVIELKSWKYIYKQGGQIQQDFEYKVQQGIKYCSQNNLLYKVVFDKDINFDSQRMKHYIINNPDVVKKYQIEFLQPDRVFGH